MSRPTLLGLLARLPSAYALTALAVSACASPAGNSHQRSDSVSPTCAVEFVVLGTGQDGGAPQLDNPNDPAWAAPELRRLATSGALIDHRTNRRFLFEATPDIRQQLQALEAVRPDGAGPLGLSGIFITHAHIGHYAGLMFAGHESAGTKGLRVFALPRLQAFLSSSGPWKQLVNFGNITLSPLRANTQQDLGAMLAVTPHLVPHRDEYSETAAFVIHGPTKNVLFLPDIDDWDRWQTEYGSNIEAMIAAVDVAYLDATFFDNNELPGRDISKIPHPRLRASVERFSALPAEQRDKVRFIHLNHSNPARYVDSPAHRFLTAKGFKVAQRGERVCLSD